MAILIKVKKKQNLFLTTIKAQKHVLIMRKDILLNLMALRLNACVPFFSNEVSEYF